MNKPLKGVRILDLTHMLSGPYGAMILADLGADVIKVEPLEGEGTRKLLAKDPKNSIEGMGAYFLTLNRNKRSVCIDLKSPDGLALFYDLVKQSDVVINNFGAGVPERLKIDFVSDVSCPWCVIGLRALEQAAERLAGEVPAVRAGEKEHGPGAVQRLEVLEGAQARHGLHADVEQHHGVAPVGGLLAGMLQKLGAAGPGGGAVAARVEQPGQAVADVGVVVNDVNGGAVHGVPWAMWGRQVNRAAWGRGSA